MLPTMVEDGVQIVFDATSAYVHKENSDKVNAKNAIMIDLTPAAIAPYCMPPVKPKRRGRRKSNERQHGELRRTSNHPNGCSSISRAEGDLR